MRYLAADRELIDRTYVAFIGNSRGNNIASNRSGNRIPNDPYQIQFQFPPRIKTDGKSGEWQETKTLMLSEPIAIFKNGNPRTFGLRWEYIVDGDTWTTERISNICKNLRGYFARTDRKYLKVADIGLYTVFMKLWLHGDAEKMSCRIENISFSHSDTIIIPSKEDQSRGVNNLPGSAKNVIDNVDDSEYKRSNWNKYDFAFPLKTEVTMDMKIWSTPFDTAAEYVAQSTVDESNAQGLRSFPEDLASLSPIRFGWF